MKKDVPIRHEFVELMPKDLAQGTLYVSIPFATAVHKCFCGCGAKVVTPLKPTGWALTYDGETVSLWPSVGNWGFPCRSHYIIRKDVAVAAGEMSQERIDFGRARDRQARDHYFARSTPLMPTGVGPDAKPETPIEPRRSWLSRLFGG